VWLDVLDLPLVYYMEASYHINGERQVQHAGSGDRAYARGGVVPTPVFQRNAKRYPMLRYPWVEVKAALQAMAEDRPDLECVQVTYVNPDTGEDAENILGFYALMLRPGQTLQLPARSPAQVFHQIEGRVEVMVESYNFDLAQADTCCVPGYTQTCLRNCSDAHAAYVFIADESPLHRKLGVYETRD
jgi:gentisate 1,2-dioxygenase